MNINEIRQYRRALRRFELATSSQRKSCCRDVTLPQCLVLLEIDEEGRLTMGQLASQLRLDSSTLSRTIDGLVGQGLVERLRDDRDRRVVRIQLTTAGADTCRSLHRSNDANCRRVFDKIPPSKRGTVIRSFETLVQAYLDCEVESKPDTGCDPSDSKVAEPTPSRTRRSARA